MINICTAIHRNRELITDIRLPIPSLVNSTCISWGSRYERGEKNPKSLQFSLWNLQWKMTSANRDNPGDSNTPSEEAGDWSPKLHALCAQGLGVPAAVSCLSNTGNPKHRMCHYCELLNCHIPSSDLSKAFTTTKTRKGQSCHQKTPKQQ